MTPPPNTASSIALLDVNVLIALVMPNHEGHKAAQAWFQAESPAGWATTPVTESGFVRVASNRSAIATSTSPSIALDMLALLTMKTGHTFLPDTVSGVVHAHVDLTMLSGYRQVTDAHLLSVALANGGRLVTFDQAIPTLAPGSPSAVQVLSTDW